MDNMGHHQDSHMVRAFKKFARTAIERAAVDYEREKERNSNTIPFSDIWEDYISERLQTNDAYIQVTRFEFQVRGEALTISDAKLANALNRLTESEREIVLMYYALKMNDNEISQVTGIPCRTVNDRRNRYFAKLQKYMENSDDEI